MICSKCGSVIPEGSTACPRCAEQESRVKEMDLELKRLLERQKNSEDRADKLTEKTIIAGSSIHAAVKAASQEKKKLVTMDQEQGSAAAASTAKARKPADTSAKRQPGTAERTAASGNAKKPAASGNRTSAAAGRATGTADHAKRAASGSASGKASQTASSRPKQGKNRKKKRSSVRTVLVAVIVAVVLVAAAVGGITAYAMKYAKYDKILPNVYIAGIDVSGLTVDEAIDVVEASMSDYAQKSVEVQLPDQLLTFTPEQDAVVMNPEVAVSAAYNYGRGGNSPFTLARAIRAAKRTENNIDISTAVTVDTASILEMVKDTAASVNQPLVETSIEADKENNVVTVTVGTEGKTLDADKLYNLVCNAFSTGDYSTIDFDYTIDYPAAVTLDSVYEMMTVEPKNAKYNPKTEKISESEDGILPDIELEEANEMLANAQQGEELVFEFSEAKADYDADELEEVLFRDTLDTTSSEIVDTKRLDNIEAACEALDDTVVQPGDSFSFNSTLGTIGYSAGYVSADVYPGDDSDTVMGGGISQVSSALYESCLYADLQITERHAHQYLPNFAKAGLDAYVKSGDADFQFVNSSLYPIRIHASVSGQTLTVYIEGTNENNYEVQLDAEKVSEDPYETDADADSIGYDGAEYHVTRTVLDEDGKEVRKDSTEDLDAMAGCGTTIYERRDGTDYSEPYTATTTTSSDTSTSTSGNSSGYYNYTTTVPSATTQPSTEPETEPATSTGGGDTGGGSTGGGDTGGGSTGGGDTGGGSIGGGATDIGGEIGGSVGGGDAGGGSTGGGSTGGGDAGGSGGVEAVVPIA